MKVCLISLLSTQVEKYCQGITSNRSAGPNPPVPLTHSSTIMHIQVPPQNAAASLQRRHSKASHVRPQVLDENVSEENKQILDASLLRALDDVDRADKIKPSGGTRDDNKLGNLDKPQKRYLFFITPKIFLIVKNVDQFNEGIRYRTQKFDIIILYH